MHEAFFHELFSSSTLFLTTAPQHTSILLDHKFIPHFHNRKHINVRFYNMDDLQIKLSPIKANILLILLSLMA
jgi:hypothetical protein